MPNRETRNYQDDAISNGRRERQMAVLDAVYGLLPQDQEFRAISYADLAQLTDLSVDVITTYIRGLDRCNVIQRDMSKPRESGEVCLALPLTADGAKDRLRELWEQEKRTRDNLTMPVDKARRETALRYHAQKRNMATKVKLQAEPAPLPVTIATDTAETTRAIAGDEPISPFSVLAPLRKDEYGALIEAVRQYTNRKNEVTKTIEHLRSLGVEVNEDKLNKAIAFPENSRLEALSELLPYVTKLEGQVETLARQLADARERAKGYVEIKAELDRTRAQLSRKIAESVAAQQRA